MFSKYYNKLKLKTAQWKIYQQSIIHKQSLCGLALSTLVDINTCHINKSAKLIIDVQCG